MVPKVLFVFTSCGQSLTGNSTDWYLPKAAYPWAVLSRDTDIDFASPAGPNPPLEPDSLKHFTDDDSVKFLQDNIVKQKFAKAKKLADVNPSEYDAVFYVGGHEPVIDLASDRTNIELASEFYQQNKLVAAVCHGVAHGCKWALKEVTGYSNAEEEYLGKMSEIPFLVENRIQELGGKCIRGDRWTEKMVVSGNVLTGQNSMSAGPLAKVLLQRLQTRKTQ